MLQAKPEASELSAAELEAKLQKCRAQTQEVEKLLVRALDRLEQQAR